MGVYQAVQMARCEVFDSRVCCEERLQSRLQSEGLPLHTLCRLSLTELMTALFRFARRADVEHTLQLMPVPK
jgi:hypothetical protein